MKAALYARVSTLGMGQNAEVQLRELREYAARRDWQAVEYVDAGVSGAKESRPQLDKLMQDVKRGKIDVVLVWKFDRFSRSVSHLLDSLTIFQSLKVQFISITDGVDTTTAMGKMVFTFLGAIAEFERSLIQERVKAGIATTRAKGKTWGRPLAEVDMTVVRARIAQGESLRSIARTLGVSAMLLSRRCKAGVAALSA